MAEDLEKRPDNLRAVLRKMHTERLVEFKKTGDTARISPKGIKIVEEELLPKE